MPEPTREGWRAIQYKMLVKPTGSGGLLIGNGSAALTVCLDIGFTRKPLRSPAFGGRAFRFDALITHPELWA